MISFTDLDLASLVLLIQDLTPDYSMESHQRDHENFLVVSRNRRRRAKALLDFERHDDDELGFRKNDIITVSHALNRYTTTCCFQSLYLTSQIAILLYFCLSLSRSCHRKMSIVGSESSMVLEV